MPNPRGWIAVERLSSVAVIVTAAVLLGARFWPSTHPPQGPKIPKAPVALGDGPTIGSSTAKAAMIYWSDFKCPYCARFATEVWPGIRKRDVDSGRLLVAFRHLPLPIHPTAAATARAADCAARQGRFWEMHDRFFADPSHLDADGMRAIASDLHLDLDLWRDCQTKVAGGRVDADVASARDFGIGVTPAFVVGWLDAQRQVHAVSMILGAKAVEEFQSAIDKAIGMSPPAR